MVIHPGVLRFSLGFRRYQHADGSVAVGRADRSFGQIPPGAGADVVIILPFGRLDELPVKALCRALEARRAG